MRLANKLFHNRASFPIFQAEFTESELKLQSSEDCTLVLLKGMSSDLIACNSCICHAGLVSLVDDLLIMKKAHSRVHSTPFAQKK